MGRNVPMVVAMKLYPMWTVSKPQKGPDRKIWSQGGRGIYINRRTLVHISTKRVKLQLKEKSRILKLVKLSSIC